MPDETQTAKCVQRGEEPTQTHTMQFRSPAEIEQALADLRQFRKKVPHESPAALAMDMAIDAVMWATKQHDQDCCNSRCNKHCEVPLMTDGSPGCHNKLRIILHDCQAMRTAMRLERAFRGHCGYD